MNEFAAGLIQTEETEIYAKWHGSGPPLLLLHGFPQTHLMWRDIAPVLASGFTVVCADLRGYGQSGCPKSTKDHRPYSKRIMARDMIELMAKLGFPRFSVAGHDRGGRVAYRMALDHPDAIKSIAVLDVLPTETVWARADARLALGFWPWSLLAQPEPLPEKILQAAPEAIVDSALSGWGSPKNTFSGATRSSYINALKDPDHIHAICEEYRAAASIDREHDQADMLARRKINCPLLTLWSGEGALANWYEDEGGPLALWRDWSENAQGTAVKGGHFFPEEYPQETAETLRSFFSQNDC